MDDLQPLRPFAGDLRPSRRFQTLEQAQRRGLQQGSPRQTAEGEGVRHRFEQLGRTRHRGQVEDQLLPRGHIHQQHRQRLTVPVKVDQLRTALFAKGLQQLLALAGMLDARNYLAALFHSHPLCSTGTDRCATDGGGPMKNTNKRLLGYRQNGANI
ncbi:hypothetical protein D3C78_634450 [compost metagenome]